MELSARLKPICAQLRLKSTQLFIVAGGVLLSLLISVLCIGLMVRYEVENEVANVADVNYWKDPLTLEQKLWYDKGIEELQHALSAESTGQQPTNVFIMVINGVDAATLAAARLPLGASFVWEQFPHMARLKNSCSHTWPCDAANVFKAIWTGVPLATALNVDTNCSNSQVLSVLRQAQLAGMRTGFVTNQRITGPTGAALYAHAAQGSLECVGDSVDLGCEDVASQLISGETGQALNVLIGGGRQLLSATVPKYAWDPVDELLCRARAKRNLLRDWRNQKLKLLPSVQFEFVQLSSELNAINGSRLDYLLAVLANGDLSDNPQAPTLQLMLNKTLQVLRRPGERHLLIAEHYVKQQMAVAEQLKLLNATLAALLDHKDELTIVLLTNGNYLSSSQEVSAETEPASTLQEAFEAEETELQRRLQKMPSESLLFAQGPQSLLFQGVHDETYLAHALSYAIGIRAVG